MKRLAVLLAFVPTCALAQMVDHKPPMPIAMPNSRDLNSIGSNVTDSPTCSYILSSTSNRPRERTSATVTLEVSPGGTPLKAEISDSSGSGHLDEASLTCAKSWHYKLAVQSAQPTSVNLDIRWRTEGPPPGPEDDVGYVGRPVLAGTAIADVSL